MSLIFRNQRAPAREAAIPKRPLIDKRIWPMMMLIGLFGYIVIKEVQLPSYLLGMCAAMGLLGLLVTSLEKPEVPFYVLLAYMPFSRILVGDFGTETFAFNMTNFLTVLVLGAYLTKSRSEPAPMANLLNKLVWLFCLLGAISLVNASFQYGSYYFWKFIPMLKRWLTPVFFYFVTLWVVRDKKVLRTSIVLIMVTVVVVAAMSVREYSWMGDSSLDKSRVGGIAEQSNTLGAFFVYYMFLFLGFFFVSRTRWKVWLLAAFLLCFRGIMVTFSRGAYLGFAAGTLSTCFFRGKTTFLMALIGVGLLAANPILLPAGVRYRMGMTVADKSVHRPEQKPQNASEIELVTLPGTTDTLDASASNRLLIWQGAFRMIGENPVWGVGYGRFPYSISYYAPPGVEWMDAHNSYLLIAAEMGIPTLIVFLLILLTALYYTHWLYRRTKDPALKALALGFLAGLCGMLVTNMFGSRMDDQAVASYFWILCGLVMRGVLMERSASTSPEGIAEVEPIVPERPRARGILPAAEYDRRIRGMRRR